MDYYDVGCVKLNHWYEMIVAERLEVPQGHCY